MKKIVDNIIKVLNDLNLTVFNCEKTDGMYLILATDLMITYNIEDNDLLISFYINIKPDVSAGYMLFFKNNIKGIKDIYVMESFYFNNDGQIISGDEAYKYFENLKNNSIINNYIRDRMQKELLINVKGFSC